MEIKNVVLSKETVYVGETVSVTFKIIGAVKPFTFPFSNESLTEPTIEFIKNNDS